MPRLAVLLAACTTAAPAGAQVLDRYLNPNVPGLEAQPGVAVTSRLHPEYDFHGVRVGGFVISPTLEEALGYDSNVTGTQTARGGPLIETNVAVQANSNWTRNSLRAGVTVDDYEYPTIRGQSYTNWTATVGGTYDLGRDRISVGYTHLNLNQTPRELDVPQLSNAIAYRVDDVQVSYRANFARSYLLPAIEVSSFSFDNGVVGGTPYLQTFRDRVVVEPSVEAGYELSTRRNLVVVLRDADASYRNQSAGVPVRDFNDVSLLGGLDYDVNGVIRLRLLAGYEVRTFAGGQKTIQAPVVEASASWNPTSLTTVTGTAARHIEDAASEVMVGYTETVLKLEVDHEYLRNVVLSATGSFARDDYQQGAGSQSLYAARVGVTWLINRNMRLAGTYDFVSRQASSAAALNAGLGLGQVFGGPYSEHRVLLRLKLGF